MAFKIVYKKSVWRDLKAITKADARRILDKIDNDLPEQADALPSLKGAFAGLRKFRVGDYRVIYALMDDTAIVLRVAHRKEVYR